MFYLAIDAGGTKTECAIADENRILGRATGASIKVTRITRGEAFANLQQVITDALAQAQVSGEKIHRSCAGVSGASIPEVRDWTAESLESQIGGEVMVTTDSVIALESAFQGGAGVLVISGTGSSVLGRNQLGLTARAGGWGPLISDEGSAHWIGRCAVAAAMRESDSGSSPELLATILRHWNLKSSSELVALCNALPPPRFADLAPHVVESAAAGDQLSLDLLTAAGGELAELAAIVIHRLWGDEPATPISVACAGAVLRNSGVVHGALAQRLRHRAPRAEVLPGVVDPVLGALWIARQGSAPTRARAVLPAPDLAV